jgi:HKD family nuclease
MTEIIPSDATSDALAAMERLVLVVDETTIRVAVAFVTGAGVELLQGLVDGRSGVTLEVVARAADATSPHALLSLRDDLGAAVSVVIGRYASAFHPKLWLFETGDVLTVLSGSGNLTSTGLRGNDEQFELATMAADGSESAAQALRFERLTARAIPLDKVEGTAIWREWLDVIKQQRQSQRELERLGRNFAQRDPQPDREADKAQLIEDLEALYRRTVEARLPTTSERAYVPSRFKQAIDRARQGADPVQLVTRVCRHRSGGFDVLFVNDRPDLTVEQLVLDTAKPYHDLFGQQTRELSAERIAQFPSRGADAAGPPTTKASPAAISPQHVTTNVTLKDIEAGQVRIPIGSTKGLLPPEREHIEVVLRGRRMTSRWDPRFGADQERLGLIRVGRTAAAELLVPGDILHVEIVGTTVHLD